MALWELGYRCASPDRVCLGIEVDISNSPHATRVRVSAVTYAIQDLRVSIPASWFPLAPV